MSEFTPQELLDKVVAQVNNDWLDMLRAVAVLSDAMQLDDGDWQETDDDTLLEQFDFWHVIRYATAIVTKSQQKEQKAQLTASEAVYGFVGWLMTRTERVTLSGRDNVVPIVELVERFCKANDLTPPREEWAFHLNHPTEE